MEIMQEIPNALYNCKSYTEIKDNTLSILQ